MKFKNIKNHGPARTCFKGGFTLLEILLVVGIISLLAGIVIVAINPAKQLATVRNTERKSDIKQLNSALTQYYIDEFEFPDTITSSSTEICDTGSTASSSENTTLCNAADLINLSVLVPDYITSIPTDPQAVTENGAGYNVLVSAGKIGLNATLAELDQTITLGIATGTGGGITDSCDVTVDGAEETTDGDYTIQTFLDDGTFTVNSGTCDVEVLVVAGGGAGGGGIGGGGGAGGLLYYGSESPKAGSALTISGTKNITIGAGGIGEAGAFGGSGEDSVFGNITAIGGGGGSVYPSGGNGGNGGSGGGVGGWEGGTPVAGSGTSGQGNNGGSSNSQYTGGAGGGGAGGVGGNVVSDVRGGNGGSGLPYSITGSAVYYAGGGGGGGEYDMGTSPGSGGIGGGGDGTDHGVNQNFLADSGVVNTGGGGGGSGYSNGESGGGAGGDGGSGVVIVRYIAAN